MQIVRSSEELARARAGLSGTLGLVPTMGALHSGHVALVEEAKRRTTTVAASLFVNPTQFGANEDFGRYPRREAQDARMLEDAGCALLWIPSIKDMYPDGFSTSIHVEGLSDRWEGEARPGHFDGVATVVAKLFISVRPDVAVFGEKDFQQLAVIRRMALDLNLPVEIAAVPTVRENDGLALSSRNAYLSNDERSRAVALPRALERAGQSILDGASVSSALGIAVQSLVEADFAKIDYVALVDASTLEPVDEPKGEMRLIAAARIGTTRLIDNLALQVRG